MISLRWPLESFSGRSSGAKADGPEGNLNLIQMNWMGRSCDRPEVGRLAENSRWAIGSHQRREHSTAWMYRWVFRAA